jgi:hypothetical protein
MEEMFRAENDYENFSNTTAFFVKKIATFYQVSASDVLAVCAMVAPSVLNRKVGLPRRCVTHFCCRALEPGIPPSWG